ncbi:hypothetical protein CIG75_07950 [Tumebacillus algifaecis]|uniref:Uncharacterized protein n=1 Tax=Tumebacillus algifaecis TaxID=1214604 RepID=A0A223D045_9BACL|nr:hypothetical protein [Tumebacillus algifaecis]ASS74921.1 hypothetical protein CIG75_07950 [Tumebacillus algifaecis]
MSIYYYSFRIGELYEAIGSNDRLLLKKAQLLLHRNTDLYTVVQAILRDGLLYHEAFGDEQYNDALTKVVQVLPSYQNLFDDKDYQIDYHDVWRKLPKKSLLREYWNYFTHGRYLFDHPIQPKTGLRYGYLLQDELPQFLHLIEQDGLPLPWYFFQQTVPTIQQTLEAGDDLFVSITIRGRRYRLLRPKH